MWGVPVFMFLLLVIVFTLLGVLVFGKNNSIHKWVAVGNGDVNLAISSDGKNWEGIEEVFGEGIGYDIYRISNGRWVIVGDDDGDDNNIWWSDDSDNWNAVSGPYGTGYVKSVYHWNGVWVTTGKDENDEGTIWWSYDAEEWSEVVDVAFEGEGNMVINLGGIWLAGGTMNGENGEIILRSENGVDWDMVDSPTSGDDSYVNTFYQRAFGCIIIAGGYGGGNSINIWYSEDDGQTWEQSNGLPFGPIGNVQKISYLNKKYYAFGDNGDNKLVFSSTDGKSWVVETIPSTIGAESEINDVDIIDGEIYAVGQINGIGGYLVGTPSENNIVWAKGTDGIFSLDTTLRSIDKQRKGPYVIGGVGNSSLVYSDSGNSDSWESAEDNPFGKNSSVLKVLYS